MISFKSNCEIFYNLKYEICKRKEKALNELPPTSSTIHGHLLKSHYFVYLCSNLLDSCSKILEPTNFGWIFENWLLLPNKNFATVPSTSLQSDIVRRDVQGIVDVRGHWESAQSIATVQIVRTDRFLELIWLLL